MGYYIAIKKNDLDLYMHYGQKQYQVKKTTTVAEYVEWYHI